MVSQEKWEKTKLLIKELSRVVEQDFLPLQRLLVIRGFLIYVVRTYPWLNPYIKGLHLTIDSWRPGREESGFKMRGKELEHALAAWAEGWGLPCQREDDDTDEVAPPPSQEARERQGRLEDEAPEVVQPTPRFWRDVACLLELTELPEPPKQLYRAKQVMAFFVIGDASSSGKGVAVVEQYCVGNTRQGLGRCSGGKSHPTLGRPRTSPTVSRG